MKFVNNNTLVLFPQPFLTSLDRFTIDGKTYDAITLPKYNGAYIIIDILNKETY